MNNNILTCPKCNTKNLKNVQSCNCGYEFPNKANILYSSSMSVADFVSSSFRVYKLVWKVFIIFSIIYAITVQIIHPGIRPISNLFILKEATLPSSFKEFLSLLLLAFVTLGFTICAHRITEGKKIAFKDSYLLTFRMYGKYLGSILLYFLGLLVFSIPLILLFKIFGINFNQQSLEIWLTQKYFNSDYYNAIIFVIVSLILSILIIRYSANYMFTPFALIIENNCIKDAFIRSSLLAKNNVFKVLFEESKVCFCMTLVIIVPLVLIGLLIIFFLQQLGLSLYVASGFAWTFGETIWVGAFIIFNVLYYKSLLMSKSYINEQMISSEKKSFWEIGPPLIFEFIIIFYHKHILPLLKKCFEIICKYYKKYKYKLVIYSIIITVCLLCGIHLIIKVTEPKINKHNVIGLWEGTFEHNTFGLTTSYRIRMQIYNLRENKFSGNIYWPKELWNGISRFEGLIKNNKLEWTVSVTSRGEYQALFGNYKAKLKSKDRMVGQYHLADDFLTNNEIGGKFELRKQ